MTIRADINKLERLMGHGYKEMLFNTYGKYVEDLENDAEAILDYLGEDFLRSVKSCRRRQPSCVAKAAAKVGVFGHARNL